MPSLARDRPRFAQVLEQFRGHSTGFYRGDASSLQARSAARRDEYLELVTDSREVRVDGSGLDVVAHINGVERKGVRSRFDRKMMLFAESKI